MKFTSKLSRLRVTLKPAVPANPIMGTPSYGGKYVMFEDGIAIVNDEETIKELLKSPDFNRDFFSLEEGEMDMFESRRSESEPKHVQQPVGGKIIEPIRKPSEITVTKEQAIEMAKEMAKEIIKESMPDMISKLRSEILGEKTSVTESSPETPSTNTAEHEVTNDPERVITPIVEEEEDLVKEQVVEDDGTEPENEDENETPKPKKKATTKKTTKNTKKDASPEQSDDSETEA